MIEPFADRIVRLRKAKQLSQQRVAEYCGVSRVAVTKWEMGQTKNLKHANIVRLAELFEIPVEDLISDTAGARSTHIDSNAEPAPRLAPPRRIPVVGTAQLGDNGFWAELEYPPGHGDGYILLPNRDASAYALRCKGDSMRPRIRDGEFVVVEPGTPPIPGDEVLVKSKDGRVMVKTLLYIREGRVHLLPVNETHPPIAIDEQDIEVIHPVTAIVKRTMWVPS